MTQSMNWNIRPHLSMHIGILQCDDVQVHLQPEHTNYPEMFRALFLAVDESCIFTEYRVLDGQLPASTGECDAWIITGSRYSAYDDFEWIATLNVFVRQLYADQCKAVGICFGHQIMAEALGGKVARSEKGWGVGLSSNQVTLPKPWMQPVQNTVDLLVSHQDQISVLPENTEVLAASDFCPCYMVQYGKTFLSIQGHPEFTKAYSKDLMLSRRDRIPAERLEEGLSSLQRDADDLVMTRWILNFMNS